MCTVWKNEKFSLTKKKFRQINYLVISLVKPLLSRNFCQKCVRVNFWNMYFRACIINNSWTWRKIWMDASSRFTFTVLVIVVFEVGTGWWNSDVLRSSDHWISDIFTPVKERTGRCWVSSVSSCSIHVFLCRAELFPNRRFQTVVVVFWRCRKGLGD